MMFNKLIYSVLAVASIGAFSACNSTDSDVPQPTSEMKFEAAEMSRASLTTDASIKNSPFAVFGDMVSSSAAAGTAKSIVFNNNAVTHNGEKWVYDNPQYWFPGQTYSFVALHPAQPDQNIVSDLKYENSSLSFTYNYPDNYNDALDILTATHRRRYTDNGEPIKFNFDHILSRLNFVAKVDLVAGGEITINSIEITNVSSVASCNLTPAPLNGSTQTYDRDGNIWDVSTQTADRTDITKEFYNNNTIAAGGSLELFPVEEPLLIIPQEVKSDIKVVLNYTRNGQVTEVTGILRNSASSHNYRWQANQSYKYTFTLGADGYLIFSKPVINAYDEDEGGSYIIIG